MGKRLHAGIVGCSKFIGPQRLSAARGVLSPQIMVEHCVPGDTKNFEHNMPFARDELDFDEGNIYDSLATMLAKAGDDIGCVIINTPNWLHLPMCITAAAAGKHIICDKPLACSLAEADDIFKATRAAGVELCTTPTYCGHPANLEARHRIRGGGIADRLRGGRLTYDQAWLMKPQADMSPDEGSVQAEWRRDPSLAGEAGASGDLGFHLLAQLHFMTGLRITRGWSMRRWVVEGKESGKTEDQLLGQVELENGATITLETTQWVGGHTNDDAWELWFDKGESYGWSQREHEFLWHAVGGDRTYLSRASFGSPILKASRTVMPPLHSDGWHDADGRLMTSFAWKVLGRTPASIEHFHPDALFSRNIHAVIDALIASSNATPERQWVPVNWQRQ